MAYLEVIAQDYKQRPQSWVQVHRLISGNNLKMPARIRVYDDAGNVVKTPHHPGDFKQR